jgi:hypothetical protein
LTQTEDGTSAALSLENLEKMGAARAQFNADSEVALNLNSELSTLLIEGADSEATLAD